MSEIFPAVASDQYDEKNSLPSCTSVHHWAYYRTAANGLIHYGEVHSLLINFAYFSEEWWWLIWYEP